MDEFCRTCLTQNQELISIYKTNVSETQLNKIISLCLGLEISKYDEFSNKICSPCFIKLQDFYKFRQLCWASNDYFMKSITETIQLEEESDEVFYNETETTELQEMDIGDYIKIYPDPLSEKTNSLKTSGSQIEKTNRNRQCFICFRNFRRLITLKRHLIKAHKTVYGDKNVPTEAKTCKICYKQLATFEVYQRHINNHKNQELKRLTNKHKRTKKVRDCYLCSESFFTMTTLKHHLSEAHNIIYNEDLIPANAKTCKICKKEVKYFQDLALHMNRHTARAPGVCKHCGKKFKSKQSLNLHIGTHTGEKPYICGKCGFRSSYPRSIVIHQGIHSNERRFECDICQMRFKRASTMKAHKLIHFDKRPFECFICKKAFKRKSYHWEHMKTHDSTKHVGCSICDQKFVNNYLLKQHMKTHTS